MLFDPKIKSRLWNLKTEVVVHNCARLKLPIPVLAMPLWERAGKNAYDHSGNVYNGDVSSLSYWSGQGLYCDDYGIEIPASHAPAINGPNTWVFHFKTTGSTRYLLDVDIVNYYIEPSQRKLYNGSGAWSPAWSTTVNDGKWHTLIVVYDGTDTHIYVDGKFDITYSGYAFGSFSGRKINIGARASYALDGTLTVVYLFDKAFSAQQAQTISNDLYGVFEPIRSFAIWSFVSGGAFYKTITGSMPSSTGSVATVGAYKQIVVGDVPNPVAAIVKHIDIQMVGNVPTPVAIIVKKTDKQFTGEQPTPTGDVVPVSIYKQTISGNTPSPTAIIVKGIKKDVVGDVPNPVAVITKKTNVQIVGSVPASTAIVIKKTEKELAGEQLASVGDVAYKSVYKQAVAGTSPATAGSLSFTIKTALAVVGNMPATIGDAIKRISKVLSGNIPTSTGNITRQTEKNIAGYSPAPAGSVSHTTKTFLSGIMGNITGILDTVFNPIPPTAVKLYRLIGSCFKKFLG